MMTSPRSVLAGCVCFAIAFIFSISSAHASTLTLRWDPSPDLAAGYRVSWGTSPGRYTQRVDVGAQTFLALEAPTPPTVYYFRVTAYDAAGNESEPSVEVDTGGLAAPTPLPLRLTDVIASPAAPQVAGTAITFTAIANGGVGSYEYQWFVFDGRQWTIGSAWSPRDTFSWRPGSAGSGYRVGAWVRSSTNRDVHTREMEFSIPFAVSASSAPSLTIQLSQPAPQPVGTAIGFTARPANQERVYSYKWWVFDGSSWMVAQEWSASPSFVWRPTVRMPDSRVLVRVVNVNDPSDTSGTFVPFPIGP